MHRLLTRAQFQTALAGGTIARTQHFAMHRCALRPLSLDKDMDTKGSEPESSGSASMLQQPSFHTDGVWLGALVPKRWARQAVTRNLIRRQIYQVGESCESGLPVAAHVVRLRARFDRQQFKSAASVPLKAAVRAELHQLFMRVSEPGSVPSWHQRQPLPTTAPSVSLKPAPAC
ncbi:MAG: ribonuclease P protein component [Variovorax sp.]